MPLSVFQSPEERAATRLLIAKTIGRQLQQVFDEDVRRPLDERLVGCLARIDHQDDRGPKVNRRSG